MFSFPQSATPAVRAHLDSQVAFFNDLSKSLSDSFQQMCQANLQLGQTMLEETMTASQRMLTSQRPIDALGAVASQAQPASEKLRAYQQHISRLAANSQVDLARVTQHHAQETSRTAHALADDVTRVATEETDRNLRQQEETLKNFRDPFQQDGAQAGNGRAQAKASPPTAREGAGASIQLDAKADTAAFRGNVQGQAARPTQQPDSKTPGKPA